MLGLVHQPVDWTSIYFCQNVRFDLMRLTIEVNALKKSIHIKKYARHFSIIFTG